MYVESRVINIINHVQQNKSSLSDGSLIYPVTKQGWLGAHELAECIDLYKANHFVSDKPHANAIGSGLRAANVAVNTYNSIQTQTSSLI